MKTIHVENDHNKGFTFTGCILAEMKYEENEKNFVLRVFLTSSNLVVFSYEVKYENGYSIKKAELLDACMFQHSFFYFFPENKWTARLYSKAFKEGKGKEIFRDIFTPINLDDMQADMNRAQLLTPAGPRGFIA